MANPSEPVTIKKYANRRLYNTGTSSYVTLEDLAAMVKAGEDFVVYDGGEVRPIQFFADEDLPATVDPHTIRRRG